MIPLVSPILGSQEKEIISQIIDSGMIASGAYVTQFENECAGLWKSKYAVATSNGTTALHAAMLAAGVKPGDEVLTTPLSFIATANSILYCGARPVFADIDSENFNLSPEKTEAALKKNKRIRAVLLVHLYGTPCDMDAFMYLKNKYGFILLEDCAQAHGALYKGKAVGTFGRAGAFSFYATKNMTTGEGGMVLCGNPSVEKQARCIINHGRKDHSTFGMLGYNYRMTNLAAGIGLVQLKHLNDWNTARRNNAKFLNCNLQDLSFLETPAIKQSTSPVFHQYTLRVRHGKRAAFAGYLAKNGIGSGIHYPSVMYLQPSYRVLGYKKGLCPEAERAAREVISIPVHPALSTENLELIVRVIRKFKK